LITQGMQTSFMRKHVQKPMNDLCICTTNYQGIVTQVTSAVATCHVCARTK